MFKKFGIFTVMCLMATAAFADDAATTSGGNRVATDAFVRQEVAAHTGNTDNPHAVTKQQIGLGNVANVDQQNADNITSGTLDTARLSVGTAANTVAAGNDGRFDTIPTTAPAGTPEAGRAFIWFN